MSFVLTLKLPFEELKERYMRHLLLQEMGLLRELSLYALAQEFLHRKEKAFALFEEVVEYEPDMRNENGIIVVNQSDGDSVYKLLVDLEDRYINAIVAYRLSTVPASLYFPLKVAHEILQSKPMALCTAQELYYMADIGMCFIIRCCELAIDKGYRKASLKLARFYSSIAYREDAIRHYEEAVAQNCPCAMYELAIMLHTIPDTITRCMELFKKSASLGHKPALSMCETIKMLLDRS